MAGPGIRYWEMANALSEKGHATAILSRYAEHGFNPDSLSFAGRASLLNLLMWILWADIVIMPGRPLSLLISVLLRKHIIVDQYDPVIFEFLEKKAVSEYQRVKRQIMLILWRLRQKLLLRFGKEFLVANDKQKDLLIGQLCISGHAHKLNNIRILPFGLPDESPVKKKRVLRGDKIKDTDFLLVWGGGIWDWFDPYTLLNALAKIKATRDDIKAYFPGINPPSPDSKKMSVVEFFLKEAKRLELLDSSVFVNNEWTPYEERADYLLEADAGVSLHNDSMETRFSFRTRILDYLWAGLPVIASEGDSWADIIEKRNLGIAVPCGNSDELARAIIRMADNKEFRDACRQQSIAVREEYKWSKLAEDVLTIDL